MQLLDEEQTYIKALIYGDPGTGKTNFGVSAPSPLILLSERQGLASIREAAKRMGIKPPPALYMSSVDDYREIIVALKGSGPGENLDVRVNGKTILTMPYPETVVLDSLSDIGEVIRADVERISPPKLGTDGLPAWTIRHWGTLGTKMHQLVLQFRDLPAHVLFLCLKDDREVGDGAEKARQVGPALPMRKMSSVVAAAVNVIGLTHRQSIPREGSDDKIEYSVHTNAPDYVLTKPYRPLKDKEEANFSHWVNVIRGGHPSPTKQPTQKEAQKDKK
jgi:hypothetical protein